MEKKVPGIGIEFGYKYSRIAVYNGNYSFRLLDINGNNDVTNDLEINEKENEVFSIPRNISDTVNLVPRIKGIRTIINNNSEFHEIFYKNEKKCIKLQQSGKVYFIEFIVAKFFLNFFNLMKNDQDFKNSQTVAITIPAYFNLEERNLILNAVRKKTKMFKNIILLTEAEAALIYQKYEEKKIYLIIIINDDLVETTKIKIGNNKSRIIQKADYFNKKKNISFNNNQNIEKILKEYNIPSINEIIVVEAPKKEYHKEIKNYLSEKKITAKVTTLQNQKEICIGAAKYAYNYDFKILNLSIGFDIKGRMTFIVKKGESIPYKRTYSFEFNSDEFTDKKIKFYQGDNNFSKNNKLLIELTLDFKKSKKKTFNIILNITESHELIVKIDEQEQKYNLELDEITEIDEKDEIINNLENVIENKNKEIENLNQKVNELTNDVDRNNQKISNLENEMRALQKDIQTMKNKDVAHASCSDSNCLLY